MATRLSSTYDLTAKYDIDYIGWTGFSQSQAPLSLGTLPKKVTGILKCSNTFIKLLLTHQGTDPFNITQGTFFDEIMDMGALTDTQLFSFISEQVSSVVSQMKDIQLLNSASDDETITDAIIYELSRNAGNKVLCRVKMLTASGQYAIVKIPVVGGG